MVLRACLYYSVSNSVILEGFAKVLTFVQGWEGDGKQTIQLFWGIVVQVEGIEP